MYIGRCLFYGIGSQDCRGQVSPKYNEGGRQAANSGKSCSWNPKEESVGQMKSEGCLLD